jgi:hypothetical protein
LHTAIAGFRYEYRKTLDDALGDAERLRDLRAENAIEVKRVQQAGPAKCNLHIPCKVIPESGRRGVGRFPVSSNMESLSIVNISG